MNEKRFRVVQTFRQPIIRNLERPEASLIMSHGVIGNTSVFGTEESRFET